jgi:DNA-binding NarL/FixJ family response regulator
LKQDINLLIIEDHKVVRTGIKFMIQDNPYYDIKIDEVDNGKDGVKRASIFQYDIILLDIELPELNGFQVLDTLKNKKKGTKIIMLTMYNDLLTIKKAMSKGADGYILKNMLEEEIFLAMKTVLSGNTYLCNEVAQTLLLEKAQVRPDNLTEREIEIIKLIVNGLTNQDISKELKVSIRTIDTHRRNIYGKLDINKSTDLIKYALKHQLT